MSEQTATAATTPATKPDSALKSFIAGGIGGACCVLVGHPLDLIKVRMQTAASATTASAAGGAAVMEESVAAMFLTTFRQSGIRGLYRGVSAPLLAVTPVFAVSFWGYDMGQRLVRYAYATSPSDSLSIGQKCLAGGFSAIPQTAIMAPSERIKCVLQTSTAGQYKGFTDCLVGVYRQGGIPSLFRGTGLTLMRDIPGGVAWFGTYELMKLSIMKWQQVEASQLSPLAVLTAGGMAGVVMWPIIIPPDVLKSRFQAAPPGTYKSIMHVYTDLMHKEGAGALFAGLRPAMIRAFPANAACFLGVEVSKKALVFLD